MNHAALYATVALSLLYDLRVRGLSWAERGVLLHLYVLAAVAPDRQTVALAGLPGEASVVTWRRALGPEGADAVGRLVECGLVAVVPEGLRATLQGAVAEALQEGRRPVARVADVPEDGAAPPARDISRAEHNLREAFRRHRLTTAEDRRAWLGTEAAQKILARNGLDLGSALDIVARTGVNRGRFGARTVITHGNHAGNHAGSHAEHAAAITPAITHLPPHTPPSEKDKENQRDSARGAAITHGNHAGSHAEHAAAITHGDHARTNDHRGVIAGGPGEGFDPLAALQVAGAPHADLMGGGELETGAAAFLVRARVHAAEVAPLAAALARPGAWWPKSAREAPKRVTLADLAGYHTADGYEFKPLAALVAHVRSAKPAARRVAEPSRDVPTGPVPRGADLTAAIAAARPVLGGGAS